MDFTCHAQEGGILPTHVIQHRAKQLELEETKKVEIVPTNIYYLDNLFDEVYKMLLPSREDYEARKKLVAFVEKFANQKIRGSSYNRSGPSVKAFGSYTMDLFTSKSDLDLSVNLGFTGDVFPRENKVKVLRKLSRALYGLQGGGKIRGVLPILGAIVPVLKFVDCTSGIECDISIENKDGILKSEMLRIFSLIDKRFQKLCYLMKAWAKAHNINSSRDRTLNSLSIILLVAFHLQTRSPPVLPPFSIFLEDGAGISEVEKRVLQYKLFGNCNKESVPQLFISLLCKLLSVESLWKEGLCASTYEGTWISKMLGNKIGCINVEDFTNRSQNAARSVAKIECETIYKCIRETLSRLQKHITGISEVSDLKTFLFVQTSESTNTSGQLHGTEHQKLGKRSMPFGQKANKKRMRLSEDEQRGDSAVGKLLVAHSGVEGTNFIPRIGESSFRNAAFPIPRSVDSPVFGHAQLPDWQPGLVRHRSRYGQGYGMAHDVPHLAPLEARFGNSFTNGTPREMLHLPPAEARFGNSFQNGPSHEMSHLPPLGARFGNSFQNAPPHEMSHLNPHEARLNSFQNGPALEMSHLRPLEARLGNSFQNGTVHGMSHLIPLEARLNAIQNGPVMHGMSPWTPQEARFVHSFQNNQNLQHQRQ